ncbi:MAG: HtaA domain-containing protein [Nocardioides sp.]|uniref:HtaA domain-containing protein n=1 Tax=Nocardioides sp. TaxID=35761 RepID=UPI0039E53F69
MSTLTDGTRRRTTRSLSGLVAAAVVATGVAFTPAAPASAAPATGELKWKISQQFVTSMPVHTFTDGASQDTDGVVSFPDAAGSYDTGSGDATVSYSGSVTGTFVNGDTEYYHVTIADPTVTVDADGSGEISAVVSAANVAFGPNAAASTDPARVVVTTFADGSFSSDTGTRSLAATPDWGGVLPANSATATDLGIAADRPVEGQAFAPTFLAQVTPGVRAHFYASGAASDANKAPAPFVAAANPTVDITTLSVSYRGGVSLKVAGENFSGVTEPGDDGVYVGVAPAGGLPDVSSPDGMEAFAGAAWVPAAAITDGTFTTTLNLPTDKLDQKTSYSLYTWQAHTHSNPSQDTETAVSIDWDKLRGPAEVKAKVTKAPHPTKKGKLKATVANPNGKTKPTGKVEVDVLRKGHVVKRLKAKKLTAGKVTFTLPKLATGKVQFRVVYLGSKTFKPANTTISHKVTRR